MQLSPSCLIPHHVLLLLVVPIQRRQVDVRRRLVLRRVVVVGPEEGMDDNRGEAKADALEEHSENRHEDIVPEHEGRVSSWVRHKVLAFEQSLEDEVRVWKLCHGHRDFALNIAGVGVASFANGRDVDVVQRTISFAKVVGITDIRGRRVREIVVEERDRIVPEPFANAGVR